MADARTRGQVAARNPNPVGQNAPVFDRTEAYRVPLIRPGATSFLYPGFGIDPDLQPPREKEEEPEEKKPAGVRGVFAERAVDQEGGADFGGAHPGESAQFGGAMAGGGVPTPGDDPERSPLDAVEALAAMMASPALGTFNALLNPNELPSFNPAMAIADKLGINLFGTSDTEATGPEGVGSVGIGPGTPGGVPGMASAGIGAIQGAVDALGQMGYGGGGAGADAGVSGGTGLGVGPGSPGGFGGMAAAGIGAIGDAVGALGEAGYGGSSSGSSSGGGDDKIVCTAMNTAYGFGGFRQAVWLAHSRELSPEYQAGYHLLFRPLVRLAYRVEPWPGQELLRGALEHIARHRTADIWRQKRGRRRDLVGRLERAALEPLCYAAGWVRLHLQRRAR